MGNKQVLKIHERVLFSNPRTFLKMSFLRRRQVHFLIKLKVNTKRESETFGKTLAQISRKLTKILSIRIFKNRKYKYLKSRRNTSLKENIGVPCGCVRINPMVMNQNIDILKAENRD